MKNRVATLCCEATPPPLQAFGPRRSPNLHCTCMVEEVSPIIRHRLETVGLNQSGTANVTGGTISYGTRQLSS